jgi:hypothetical protein
MKINSKTGRMLIGLGGAASALYLGSAAQAQAQVSTEDFNALKAVVQKLSDQVQSLSQSNALAQQIHEQDLQQLHALEARLADTQKTATDAEQKSTQVAEAQAAPPVNHNFHILGDADIQYVNTDHQPGSFLLADFAPIFLYRAGDNILFEAGFDTTLQNNAPNSAGYTTGFDLSFAQLDYVATDYLTFCLGDLLLPLGTYTERGAGWLNKIPDNPLAVDALLPGTGLGVEARGALAVDDAGKLFNYAAYLVNGPGSADGTGNAGALDLGGNVGIRSDGVAANLHNNPSGGGRLGFFVPFKPHYDVEVGVSGQVGEWDPSGSHLWMAGVIDATVHLGPNFEAKGQYMLTRYGSDDQGTVHQQGWYVQAGYKLAGLDLEMPVINNVELLGRYDSVFDGINPSMRRYTAGFVYYFTSTMLFEGDYEWINSADPNQPSTQLLLQISYGF